MTHFKLLFSLLALGAMLTFTACGGDDSQEDTDKDTTETTETTNEDTEPSEAHTDKPELEATADECGETMAKYIDLINKHTAVYEEYVENPDDDAMQARLDELNEAAEPLQKEIEEKGRAFYVETYDTECWETYTRAVQRLGAGATKAASKMLEEKMPEMQNAMEDLGEQLQNME